MYLFTFLQSPRIFTKIIKVAITFLRSTFGLFITFYLDDILIMAPTLEDCHKALTTAYLVLTALGFGISLEKSSIVPSVGLLLQQS